MAFENIARGDTVRLDKNAGAGLGLAAPTQTDYALLGTVLNINVAAGVTTCLIRWRGGPANAVTNDGRGEETTELIGNLDNLSFRVLGKKAEVGPLPAGSSNSSSSSSKSSVSSNSSSSSSSSESSESSESSSSKSSVSSVSSSKSSVSSVSSSKSSVSSVSSSNSSASSVSSSNSSVSSSNSSSNSSESSS